MRERLCHHCSVHVATGGRKAKPVPPPVGAASGPKTVQLRLRCRNGFASFRWFCTSTRDRELQGEAAVRVALGPEPAPVSLHDRTADGQSHSHAGRFGCEKGLEHPRQRLVSDGRPIVADRDSDGGRRDGRGLNHHLARRAMGVLHRLGSVPDQVQDDLLELKAVPDGLGQLGRQFHT